MRSEDETDALIRRLEERVRRAERKILTARPELKSRAEALRAALKVGVLDSPPKSQIRISPNKPLGFYVVSKEEVRGDTFAERTRTEIVFEVRPRRKAKLPQITG